MFLRDKRKKKQNKKDSLEENKHNHKESVKDCNLKIFKKSSKLSGALWNLEYIILLNNATPINLIKVEKKVTKLQKKKKRIFILGSHNWGYHLL